MSQGMILIFMIALSLFIMQSIGGYFQIQDYKKAVSRVHKRGNVGIGQKRGRLFDGYLVLIACDSEGIITYAETMEGPTFLSKFKPRKKVLGQTLEGTHIEDLLTTLRGLDKKKKKRMKGYIQALDALELRLYPELYEANHVEGSKKEKSKEIGNKV